jgi:hypothetical protein
MFPSPRISLSQSTCVTLSGDEFFGFLDSAPFLKDFTCSVGRDSVLHYPDGTTHNCLQSLTLIMQSSTHFLPLIRLPVLKTLHIASVEIAINDADFIPFLSCSAASLRTFSTGIIIPVLSVSWFSIMSGLTDISLCKPERHFLSEFLSRLNRTEDEGFLPRLQTLTFLGGDVVSVLDNLVQALSSRSTSAHDGVDELQSFRWNCPAQFLNLEPSMLDSLRGLAARGMRVRIQWK